MSTARIQSARRKAFERQNSKCFYCKVSMWLTSPFELDGCKSESSGYARLQCTAEHLLPRGNGGQDCDANIVAACAHCNRTRPKRVRPPAPEAYRKDVARRVKRGAWHHPWVHARGLLGRLQPQAAAQRN